jgi:DNA-nicking Smr family endonuclease
MTGRRLAPEEKLLWGRVMATVKPLHPVKAAPLKPPPLRPSVAAKAVREIAPPAAPVAITRGKQKPVMAPPPPVIANNLDSHWDRRFHKGVISPDISVDLHGQGLATAYARLDHTLEQAIHQNMRVILLVTGNPRAHDRASGQGRGAIASVVRDWLAASRHGMAGRAHCILC